ncbi:small multi-drug export protein [Candidatus Gracilibacteria bacterium]|jgi:uncharacterized membrane protein|nr:small multi-drug export protein [Candidatus Gracilibacteria bacterium]
MFTKLLITYLLAGVPMIEARFALPIGYKLLGLGFIPAFIASYLGALTAITLLAIFIHYLHQHFSDQNFIKKKINQLIAATKSQRKPWMETLKTAGLTIFIALPLPLSGTFTGIVMCYLAGLSFKRTMIAGALGNLIALILVSLIVESVDVSSEFFYKFLMPYINTQ